MSTIYLDNNATTPILPEVVQAMLIDLDGIPRNPSSITRYGREGRDLLIQARKQIASYFNVLPEEIYFTSGGTEGNHFLIQGFHKRFPGTIYSTTIEHPSVLKALPPHKLIPVDETGAPTLDAVEEALLTRPAFLVLSGAYTETGVLLPLHRVADLCKKHDTPPHH